MIDAHRLTMAEALLRRLADERRRVLSDWRALVLLRRASVEIGPQERRWQRWPATAAEVAPTLRGMVNRGELRDLPGLPGMFEVTVPYATTGPLDEREVLLEANPFAVLSHFSALTFHGLTEQQPRALVATAARSPVVGLLPVGTTAEDRDALPTWADIRPDSVLRRPVRWATVTAERLFGAEEYDTFGAPLRVTDLERTLVDAVQQPGLCGGIGNVLRAWVLGADRIDLDHVVAMTERYDIAVLRQRVGFVLDRLDRSHPVVERWRAGAARGGSSRLVAAEPFAATFDERWNLSINAPTDAFEEQYG